LHHERVLQYSVGVETSDLVFLSVSVFSPYAARQGRCQCCSVEAVGQRRRAEDEGSAEGVAGEGCADHCQQALKGGLGIGDSKPELYLVSFRPFSFVENPCARSL
jgi:hypothetical protein